MGNRHLIVHGMSILRHWIVPKLAKQVVLGGSHCSSILLHSCRMLHGEDLGGTTDWIEARCLGNIDYSRHNGQIEQLEELSPLLEEVHPLLEG